MIEQQDLEDALKRLRKFYPAYREVIEKSLGSREALDRIRIHSLEAIGDVGTTEDLWEVRIELLRVAESIIKALAL